MDQGTFPDRNLHCLSYVTLSEGRIGVEQHTSSVKQYITVNKTF